MVNDINILAFIMNMFLTHVTVHCVMVKPLCLDCMMHTQNRANLVFCSNSSAENCMNCTERETDSK